MKSISATRSGVHLSGRLCYFFKFIFIYYLFWGACPKTCGIFIPQPEIKSTPPAAEAQTLNHWTAREVRTDYFSKSQNNCTRWPFFKCLFTHVCISGCARSSLLCGLSLVSESGDCCLLRSSGFSLQWLLLPKSPGCVGFSSWGKWAQQWRFPGSRAQTWCLWSMDLVAPQHVGSSWTRDRTNPHFPALWILYHWTTREALCLCFFYLSFHPCFSFILLN